MAQACKCCTHPARAQIDAALVAGVPNRRVASQYGLSEAAVRRHRAHLPATVVVVEEARREAGALNILGQAQELLASAQRILERAEARKDDRVALLANREAAGRLELLAKIMAAAMQAEAERVDAGRFLPPPVNPPITLEAIDCEIERLEAEQWTLNG